MANCEVKIGEGEHGYHLSFDVSAAAIAKAVWLERNNRIVRGEREGVIAAFDSTVALINDGQPLIINTNNPDCVVTEFTAFSGNTSDAAGELARLGMPDHENEAPSQRIQLGADAQLLANSIEEQLPPLVASVEEIAGLNAVLALDIGADCHALAVHLDTRSQTS